MFKKIKKSFFALALTVIVLWVLSVTASTLIASAVIH